MHNHHIVFRSQGGLDTRDNLINLTYEQHEGRDSPHQSRAADLALKKQLQDYYFSRFTEDEYSIEQIAFILHKSERFIEQNFRKVKNLAGIYKREDIIRKLMGGKIYI